ncbi:MAG: alpha/beta hydrolase family protein, partial [Candidatus Hermodarchaeota archaeon]
FFILLPNFIKVISWQMAPYTDDEVIITTVSYESEIDGENNIIVGNLFQPAPKFGNREYPGIIACHGYAIGGGKESMHRWCVELARRGFVVFAIDLPGNGMSVGKMDTLPRKDLEPEIVEDGIKYLKDLEFVDENEIGLFGTSYGGATVSLCAGVLGNLIDATISINTYYNFTDWLIEDLLPDAEVKFSVRKNSIILNKIEDTEITKDNIKEILNTYGLIRGNEEIMEDLIIDGTNRLDRKFLRKFDAVEYLPNVKSNSMMFLRAKKDDTFSSDLATQGYNAIISANKSASYIKLDDNHELSGDPGYTSDYIIINFFEEKLKDVDLGQDWESDFDKYSQERDIELGNAPLIGLSLIFECLILFVCSLIPFFIIISIVFSNKKVATERANKEEEIINLKNSDDTFFDLSFGRGSYYKTIILLLLLWLVGFTTIIGISLGFFSELIAGTLCAAFYLVLYLMLYFLPDQAEVDLWNKIKEKKNKKSSRFKSNKINVKKFSKISILFSTSVIVIISTIIGYYMTFIPKFFYQPVEPIINSIFGTGISLFVGGLLLIFIIEEKKHIHTKSKRVDWKKYHLGKYQILKSLVFGSILFMNIIFQLVVWAFYMKFPFMIGPHSIYFFYAAFGVVIFFAGVQILTKLIKENLVKEASKEKNRQSITKSRALKIFDNLLPTIFGLIVISITITISLYHLFDSITMRQFFNFIFSRILKSSPNIEAIYYIVVLFCIIYLVTGLIKKVFKDKGNFGVSIFVPLLFFMIIAFILHI